MSVFDDRKPLVRFQLIRAKRRANGIVENLSRRSGQRAEARLAQHFQKAYRRKVQACRSVHDLKRRECVDMDAGR